MNHPLSNPEKTAFGFSNLHDFLESAFKFADNPKVITLGASLGLLASFVEQTMGMKAIVFLCFLLLSAIEFFTGIGAALKQGQKIQSHKLPRTLIKMIVYTIIIAIMHILSQHFFQGTIAGFEVNIYKWMYYSVVNIVILQLFISVFENLSKMGYGDSIKIVKFFKSKLNKWLDLDEITKEEEKPQEIITEQGAQTNVEGGI